MPAPEFRNRHFGDNMIHVLTGLLKTIGLFSAMALFIGFAIYPPTSAYAAATLVTIIFCVFWFIFYDMAKMKDENRSD